MPTTGGVTGVIRDFTTGLGLGGVLVTVGSQSAYSNSDGSFTVTNIPPGPVDVVVTPPDGFVLPAGFEPIHLIITAGAPVALPTTIRLMDDDDNPPGPPTG